MIESDRSPGGAVPADHIRPLLQPEASLLWSLAQWDPETIPPDHDRVINWPLLLFMAEQERALWVVDRWVQRTDPGSIAAEAREHLHELAQVEEFRMVLLAQRVEALTKALNDAGLTPWLLKGAALSRTHYRTYAERQMQDIDVLVEQETLPVAERVALEQGWETTEDCGRAEFYGLHHHGPPMVDSHGSGLVLEIHHDLVRAGHPFRSFARDVLAQGRDLDVGSGLARVPLAPHHLVYIGIHYAWSHSMGFGAWTAFRDIRVLAGDPDVQWDEVVRLARVSNAATCCYWSFRLARALVGADVPSEVLERLRPGGPAAIITFLERHYVAQSLRATSTQLPQLLHRWLWRMGVQPGRSNHRGAVPWLRDPVFQRYLTPTTAPERRRLRRRIKLGFRASGYLGALVLRRSPRRQRLEWE